MRKRSMHAVVAAVAAGALGGAVVVAPPAAAAAGDVTTIAGTGVAGFAGDGGAATAAQLNGPRGIAVAPDGTSYFADNENFRIRRISTAGQITTIAGNGMPPLFDDVDGDGGPAVDARLAGVLSVALSPDGHTLYVADIDNNRVRQVDLVTGTISNFAGEGLSGIGFAGDGGPALAASFAFPTAVAVDGDGDVVITDQGNCRIREVDAATDIITTVAGSGCPATIGTGDGGPALDAELASPEDVAVDDAGNLYVLEADSHVVRRADAVTGVITTVAGGGSTVPGFGPATQMDLGNPEEIAVDGDRLFIANASRVLEVDLATGTLSVLAGTGTAGYTGDGGPALSAQFDHPDGLAVTPTGSLLVSDAGNHRIRSIEPAAVSADVVIDLLTSQAFLDALTQVPGSLLLVDVDGRDFLVVPTLTSVGLDVTVTDNDELLVIDLSALETAGGSITITGNLVLESLDLSALTEVGGLTVADNPEVSAVLISGMTNVTGDLTLVGTAATVLDLAALTTVGGSVNVSDNASLEGVSLPALTGVTDDVNVSGNASATGVSLPALTETGGSVNVSANDSATGIVLDSLTTVGGSVNVSANASATGVSLPALTETGGSVNVSDNASATGVSLPALTETGGSVSVDANDSATGIVLDSLTTVGGSVSVSANASATGVSLPALTETGGSVSVSANDSATGVELPALTSVGGSVNVSANASETGVELGSLSSVAGDLMVESSGTGTFDVEGAEVGGDTDLTLDGYTIVAATTAGGTTTVETTHPDTTMEMQLGAATFVTPVDFTITRLDPATLPPEEGTGPGGGDATVDPVAAYELTFGVPTLGQDATLTFDVHVDALDDATRSAFLAALEAGTATLATQGDAADGYQAFPLCAAGQPPTADGCVRVELLDADGQPTTGTPAVVRFSNVVGHFSTWAVVLVSEAQGSDTTPPTITAEVSPPPDVRGWHLPPVTVEFSCADAETEVADCPAALTLTEPGIHPVEGVATDGAGNEAATSLEVPVARPVGIDVVPFIGLNLIPCRASNAPIPVAILSGPGFDARAVDADSVRFGRTGDEAAAFLRDRHGRPIGHVLDVNRDRRPDLVLYFRLGDTGFGCGDIGRGALIASVPAVLTGVADGVGIHAQSTLRLVGLGR